MAVRTLFIIGLYFAIRLIIHLVKNITPNSARKYKIMLGIFWIPVGTLSYWFSLVDYVPLSFCLPPMHIVGFLGWIIYIVTDSLYQLFMISRNPDTDGIELL